MGTAAEFEAAFADIVRCAERAAGRVLDRAQAEDIAAEAAARAWLHWDALDLTAAKRWVARVATNLAIDAIRRQTPAETPRPARAHDDQVVVRASVAEAVRLLPPRQRDAVVLRHFAGMSQVEIAETLGIARSTAAVHLARGEAALRCHLFESQETHGRTRVRVETLNEAVDAMASGDVLSGVVTAASSQGLEVDVGIAAFMPARFVDVRPVDDLQAYIGRPVDCVVRAVAVEQSLVFVSRMHAIESSDDREGRRTWFAGLRAGDVLPAVVSSQVAFGWFVELAGGTGLVHISETTGFALAIGDRILVEIIRVDANAERISVRPAG